MHIFDLPSELLLQVLKHLDVVELCRCVAPVCSRFRSLSLDPALCTSLEVTKWTRKYEIKINSKSTILRLTSRSPLLKSLDLSNLGFVDDILLETIIQSCPQLRHVYLAFCVEVSEDALHKLFQQCNLQSLDLEGCCNLEDETFTNVQPSCLSGLAHLNLSHCSILTDLTLTLLTESCPKLCFVNFDGVRWLSEPAILSFLLHRNAQLRHLDLVHMSALLDTVSFDTRFCCACVVCEGREGTSCCCAVCCLFIVCCFVADD
eukprot:m.43973 g.43973  ORF g.43973 m.43973 type:complete len:261 (+) comp17199_c0_seq4:42-824(+)